MGSMHVKLSEERRRDLVESFQSSSIQARNIGLCAGVQDFNAHTEISNYKLKSGPIAHWLDTGPSKSFSGDVNGLQRFFDAETFRR